MNMIRRRHCYCRHDFLYKSIATKSSVRISSCTRAAHTLSYIHVHYNQNRRKRHTKLFLEYECNNLTQKKSREKNEIESQNQQSNRKIKLNKVYSKPLYFWIHQCELPQCIVCQRKPQIVNMLNQMLLQYIHRCKLLK